MIFDGEIVKTELTPDGKTRLFIAGSQSFYLPFVGEVTIPGHVLNIKPGTIVTLEITDLVVPS